ncbi:MAG: hypothetical protein R2708_17350 [Vicinamibacterales bacterium]
MSMSLPEPWLRGPLPGIQPLLQPAAHAFVMAREDVDAALEGLDDDDLWAAPAGLTPLGFHVAHLSNRTDRLLTCARGLRARRDTARRAGARARDRQGRPSRAALLAVAATRRVAQLAATPESTLTEARPVGRAHLPSTVAGLPLTSARARLAPHRARS